MWEVDLLSYDKHRPYNEAGPVWNKEKKHLLCLGGSDEEFICTKNVISAHCSQEDNIWHRRLFWKRGRVCIHLEQIWLKQVSSSNCLGRGPWGINCTTDENYWRKKSNGRTQKDEWQRLKTGKRMIRWSRLKEGQDQARVWGAPNLTQYQFLHNAALICLQRIKKENCLNQNRTTIHLCFTVFSGNCASTYDKMYPLEFRGAI